LTHYEDVLSELREKGSMLANKYIVELYNILRYEENLPPEDCRAMIEHDCIDLWSKATIRKYLPPESKDDKKQKAGKIGAAIKAAKNKNAALLLLNGHDKKVARTNLAENDSVIQNEQESKTFFNEIDQKLSARELSPELLEIHSINAEKDRKIEELEEKNKLLSYELERNVIKGGFKVHRAFIDHVIRIANEIRDRYKENDYLYIITQGSDVLAIVDHMPVSDEEIQELVG
jgi:hypothetical protein